MSAFSARNIFISQLEEKDNKVSMTNLKYITDYRDEITEVQTHMYDNPNGSGAWNVTPLKINENRWVIIYTGTQNGIHRLYLQVLDSRGNVIGNKTIINLGTTLTNNIHYDSLTNSIKWIDGSNMVSVSIDLLDYILPLEASASYTIDEAANSIVYTVSAENPYDAGMLDKVKLFTAEYDDNGKLLKITSGEKEWVEDNKITVTSKIPDTGNAYKIMLWDGALHPLINTVEDAAEPQPN